MADILTLFTLMAMMATPILAVTDGECTLPFYKYGDDCLYFSVRDNGTRMSWSQAREACKLIGGDLAHNFSVDTLLKDDDFFSRVVGRSSPWVGASNHMAQGVFTWLDSNRVVLGPWYERHPNSNPGVTNCVWLKYSTFNELIRKGFGVSDCESLTQFMCQK
ncbi:unnamed protein product [Meganyctiphanes norvegica]|uniref:C-type lectin domain-containing protein n=1 Tax=Meganyctiphanes norvegica TaxID=48144 RepID=A0AAV2S9U1_MEGNR